MSYSSVYFVTHVFSLLQFESQDMSYCHIIDVYEWDLGMNRAFPGLRKLHKLKEEHVRLSSRLRMQGKLAAQVSSFM